MRPEPKYRLFHDESDTPPGVVALAGVLLGPDHAGAFGDGGVAVVGLGNVGCGSGGGAGVVGASGSENHGS